MMLLPLKQNIKQKKKKLKTKSLIFAQLYIAILAVKNPGNASQVEGTFLKLLNKTKERKINKLEIQI